MSDATQTTDPNMNAAAPATDTTSSPPTPTIDTSLPEGFSLYEPGLKKGIQRLLVQVTDFGPSTQEDGTFLGWSFTGTLMQEAEDDSGGKLPVGTRMQKTTIFTTPSQYRTQADATKMGVEVLMGLNNIPVNTRNRASAEAALAAYRALDPSKRLPTPGQPDTDAAHYEQWKGGQVVAVYQCKEGKDGQTRVNCLGLEAASTAKV